MLDVNIVNRACLTCVLTEPVLAKNRLGLQVCNFLVPSTETLKLQGPNEIRGSHQHFRQILSAR